MATARTTSKKKSATKKSAARATLPPVEGEHVTYEKLVLTPRALSVSDAFHALREEAARVSKEQAVEFQADLTLALHNARTGVAAITPHLARVAKELPAAPLTRVLDLPNYVRAAIYAESKSATPRKVTREDIAEKLAALQKVRVPAILQLQVFKHKEMAEAGTVDAIVEGRGVLNFAQDGIDIERLFTENAEAWSGKHPFTTAEIADAGRLGNWLLDNVQPDGATPRPTAPNEYDLLTRQLWALCNELHRHLRTAGIVLWGEDGVDARVPRLQTRQVTRTSRGETDIPAAPAAPT
jgi:hypothetical protein